MGLELGVRGGGRGRVGVRARGRGSHQVGVCRVVVAAVQAAQL